MIKKRKWNSLFMLQASNHDSWSDLHMFREANNVLFGKIFFG